MKQLLLKTGILCSFAASALFAEDNLTGVSIVDFGQCISESKYGKEEQKNIEKIRNQVTSLISETDKELQELNAKFEDTTFLDSLSPKAEEELRARHQALSDDRQRYQWQFGQIMQQAQMQFIHKMSSQISRASERIAEDNQLDYVINKEACFYYRPHLDLTSLVINEMDRNFDLESRDSQLSENSENLEELSAE